MIDPKISKYMSEISQKRKTKVGGFNSDAVQKKALETRRKNAQAKLSQKSEDTTETTKE